MEPGPVATPLLTGLRVPWSPPSELAPVWDDFVVNLSTIWSDVQAPDDCAAYFLRAVTDPTPALRYMTHPPSREVLLKKVADLDGGGVAAVALTMVARNAPADGSALLQTDAERSDK